MGEEKKGFSFGMRIGNFPAPLLAIIMVVTITAMMMGVVPNNMVGALGIMFGIGILLNYIGDRIPIWNEYVGGGIVLTFMFTAWLVHMNFMPEKTAKTISTMMDSWGFLNLYVAVLITGSILSIERRLLIRSLAGYIPCLFGGIFTACAFGVLAGMLFGKSMVEVLVLYAIPIMGGGTGAGAVPMSEIYANVTGQDPGSFMAVAYPILTIANIMCIVAGSLLDKLGKVQPALTGEGVLVKSEKGISAAEAEDKDKGIKIDLPQVANGLTLAAFFFVFGNLLSKKINVGVEIHTFAYMVVLVALFNILGWLPEDIKGGAKRLQNFFVKWITPALMVGVGVAYINLQEMIEALNFANMVIALFVVIGAIVGTGLVGLIVGFYPIEAAITAGLCMANRGGSGDIAVLGAAKRMELISYAQISSRIGGGIMLVIASIVFPLLTK